MPPPLEKLIFLAASGLSDEAERRVLIERACAGDVALRKRVEALFAVQGAADDYFEAGSRGAPRDAGDAQGERLGTRIGRYRLIRRAGDGGCGVVYLAEQVEPVRREVALKIVRPGMDTEEVIARFESERRALALMDHPNIARVLDAGATDSGRPFFVMEFVDGRKITDFCDAHRLGLRPRLELMIQVCLAIQHAHQKGVIHRDLKPSNVLVRMHDGAPTAKVIDFGIAKATGPEGGEGPALTRGDRFVGTPAYLSPEMAAGGADLDTRSDIHGLGVLLHELLCGSTPFAGRGAGEAGVETMRRLWREADPRPPSRSLAALPPAERAQVAARRGAEPAGLLKALRGDLDGISLKAMARDRERRYETAYGLASDLRRHLADEPVNARPPEVSYRVWKFVRRNRVAVGSGVLVAAAMLAATAISTRMFFRERQARAAEASLRVQAELRERVAQAAVLLSHGDIAGADGLLAQVPFDRAPLSLEAAQVYSKAGEWHVLAGRWGDATDRFATRALVLPGIDPSDSDAISITLLPAVATLCQAGDRARYDVIRATAVERFAGTSRPVVAEQVLKACLLAPATPEMVARLRPLAERLEQCLVDGHPELVRNPSRVAWSWFALALLRYREGDWEGARIQVGRCLAEASGANPSRDAAARCLLALIGARQGRSEEAAAELARARAEIESRFAEGLRLGDVNSFWFDWVNARVLSREAAGVLDPAPAASLGKK